MMIENVDKRNVETQNLISNLAAFYDFPPMFTRYAVELSKRRGYKLEDTFRYVETLREVGGDFDLDDSQEPDDLTPEVRLRECGDNEFTQKMFFERGISWSLIYAMRDFGLSDEDMQNSDPIMLRTFTGTYDMAFSYYKRAWEYYRDHKDDRYIEENFDQYVEYLDEGYPIEEAFDMVYPGSLEDDVDDDLRHTGGVDTIDEREYDEFDKWAEIETDWNKQTTDYMEYPDEA